MLKNTFIFCKKDINIQSVASIISLLDQKGIRVFVENWIEPELKTKVKNIQSKENLKDIDLVIVLGGDGAILRASQKVIAEREDIPILGINMGRLGFMTFGEDSFPQILQKVLADEFKIEIKPVMFAEVNNEKVYAINDFVIRSSDERIREFEITAGEEKIGKVRADGVIISTQTGSTAYNLSVGGPIVLPGADVFVISFIAPFSLWARSIIVSAKEQILVKTGISKIKLCADGNVVKELNSTTEIIIGYSENRMKILKSIDSSFYKTLKEKMGWDKE